MVSRRYWKEEDRKEANEIAKKIKNGMTYEAQSLIDSVSYSPEEQADINLSKVCRSMK